MLDNFIKTGMEFAEAVALIERIIVVDDSVLIVFKAEAGDKIIKDVRSCFLIGFWVGDKEVAVKAINCLSPKGSVLDNTLTLSHPEGVDMKKCSCVRILHIDGRVVREEFFRKSGNRLTNEY